MKWFPREIIVVDDGSGDATRKVLDLWQSRIHPFIAIAFHNPVAQGPGKARNIGVQLASGRAVGFTDDDCVVHPAWVQAMAKSVIWSVGSDCGNIAGIGGRVVPFRGGLVSNYFTFHRILEPPRYNQYLVTANACYLRYPLEAVGGFDEGHRFPGGEDNALSFKLAREGFQFGYDKHMVVRHDYRTSLPSFIQTFFRYGKGCAEVTQKYLFPICKSVSRM
jgi:glycosyltransferase involved in cell wall biosynthesis